MESAINKSKISLGKTGEAIASAFLQKNGYKIIDKNFRHRPFGEIDIIAKDKDTLVFIEVKCRRSLKFGPGRESVTAQKQRKIRNTALYYLHENKIPHKGLRFDVVEILMRGEIPEITLIKEAF